MEADWFQKARELKSAVDAAPSGARLLTLEQTARQISLSEQSARHMLRAYTFVEHVRVTEPDLAARLTSLPYQSVLTIRKWHERDRQGLRRYLSDHSSFSIREIDTAERAARAQLLEPGYRSPAQHAIDVLETSRGPIQPGSMLMPLLGWAKLKIDDLAKLEWRENSPGYDRTLGILFRAQIDNSHAGIMVASNSQLLGTYDRNAKSIWSNAVCATTVCPLLIVLLPSREAQNLILKSMPLPPSSENGWPSWRNEERKDRVTGPSRPASPGGGVIIFTTPETIESDWQA